MTGDRPTSRQQYGAELKAQVMAIAMARSDDVFIDEVNEGRSTLL
jgi:hypothetical protein